MSHVAWCETHLREPGRCVGADPQGLRIDPRPGHVGANMSAAARGVVSAGARLLLALGLAALLLVARSPSAGAVCPALTTCWTGASTTDWFDPTSWTAGTPNSTNTAIITQSSPSANPTIGINGTSNAATSNRAVIGDLTGTTGAVTVNTTNVGLPASWTISGDGTTPGPLVNGPLTVGGSGTGFLTITNGAAVTTTGNLGNVVIGSVGTGTITIGSATAPNLAHLSTLTNNGPLFEAGAIVVGDSGNGTLIVNQDGAVSGFEGARLGEGTGSQGTVTVNGGSLNVVDPHTGFGELDVGLSGHGTLTIQNGGTVTSAAGVIATVAGSGGSSATVTGTNSIWNITGGASGGSLTIGNGDLGSLSILAGGTVNAAGANSIYVGPAPSFSLPPPPLPNGAGTLIVDNGRLIANGATINVGVFGSAGSTMTVRNGAQVVGDGGSIGGFVPISPGVSSTGVVTVTGAGALFDDARDSANAVDATSNLFIDNPVSMTGLVIQQGGQVITGSAFVSDFGQDNTVNTVVVDGAGSKWTTLAALNIGYFSPDPVNFPFHAGASTGAVTITNGGQVAAASINIGVLPDGGAGAIDKIAVSGTGSNLQASGMLAVGLFGAGDLTVSNGATVSASTGVIGFSSAAPGSLTQTGVGVLDTSNLGANSVGTVTVTGAGSTWTVGSLIVGDNTSTDTSGTFTGIGGGSASGTLTVANGGAVNVGSGAGVIDVALNAGATGIINIGAPAGQTAVAPGTISASAIVFGAGTGSIVFNHTSTSYTFGIPLQGNGSVDVESGRTILTATNTYTGTTTINGGVLEVDGSIANSSSVTVNAGGTLTGSGTVGTTQINAGGTLAPGAAGGTAMAIAGTLTFQPNALYVVLLGPATATIADVSGTASLAGIVQVAGTPVSNKTYDILHSAGLGGTRFSGVVGNNVTGTLSYSQTDVFLTLDAALGSGANLNQNQQNVANAINTSFNNGGTLPPALSSLFGLSGTNLANALTQLSGEAATQARQGAFELMDDFLALLTEPTGSTSNGSGPALPFAPESAQTFPSDAALAYAAVLKAPPLASPHWTTWGAAFGGSNTTRGDPISVGSHDSTARAAGVAAGMDYRVTPDTILGFALAGGGTNWSLSAGLGGGRDDAAFAGVYGSGQWGQAYLSGALSYASHWMSTSRTITVAGPDTLTASFNAQSFGGRLESGYRMSGGSMSSGSTSGASMMSATPYAAVQAQWLATPSYNESGSLGVPDPLGLTFASQTGYVVRSELGARFDQLFPQAGRASLDLLSRIAWAHDWQNNPALSAVFIGLPTASFVVNGAAAPNDLALVTAGAEWRVAGGWSTMAKFDGELGQRFDTYTGTARIKYSW